MNIESFKKLVRNLTEESLIFDEPYVSERCEERGISPKTIRECVIGPQTNLERVEEDRPKVYKVYYRLSRKVLLEIIIDFHKRNKINVRTVARQTYPIKALKKQRF